MQERPDKGHLDRDTDLRHLPWMRRKRINSVVEPGTGRDPPAALGCSLCARDAAAARARSRGVHACAGRWRQLAVVLCDADSAYLHPPAGHEHAGHDMAGGDMAGHDMSGHDHAGGHQHTHPDSTCPYAQSAGATPIPFFAALTPAMVPSASVFSLLGADHRAFRPCSSTVSSRTSAPRLTSSIRRHSRVQSGALCPLFALDV